MGFAPLLDSDVSGACKRLAKKRLLVKRKTEKILLLTLNCAPGSPVWHAYTSHRC